MSFANSGAEALEMLRTSCESESFDVVISDMRMPAMDGATLLTKVREHWPGVIRVILSGYTEVDAAVRAIPVAHQFLMKPCDAVVLQDVITQTCRKKMALRNPEIVDIVDLSWP